MTSAPPNLLAVRSLLLTYLDVDESRARAADLEPAEVGIVGDPAHRGGYHCGHDRVVSGDYSVTESTRDREGLTEDSSALDVGPFSVTVKGEVHNLQTFSRWCVAQCVAGAPDTLDIREIIYSPDGEVVRRWDRLKRRATGDDSHLWHTHFSFFRDSIRARRDQTPLFRRYLTTIGLIPQEDDMALTEADIPIIRAALHSTEIGRTGVTFGQVMDGLRGVPGQLSVLVAAAGRDTVDEGAIVAGILATLTPERIAAAIPEAQAKAVADELAARLAA